MSFSIPKFSAQEIVIALQKLEAGDELTDREIAALDWEVEY